MSIMEEEDEMVKEEVEERKENVVADFLIDSLYYGFCGLFALNLMCVFITCYNSLAFRIIISCTGEYINSRYRWKLLLPLQ